jgi:hypothetical protein
MYSSLPQRADLRLQNLKTFEPHSWQKNRARAFPWLFDSLIRQSINDVFEVLQYEYTITQLINVHGKMRLAFLTFSITFELNF